MSDLGSPIDVAGVAIGVVGVGRMGSRHALNVHRLVGGARIEAVMDRDAQQAALIAGQCGDTKTHQTAEDLIADPAVEAVIIASPESTHADLTRACIHAGKPVLCEKPLATTVEDARSVVAAELEGGRRLVSVGFMREFDPSHRRVAEVLQSGAVGEPVFFRSRHDNLSEGSPRTVEHVVVNSAIHDLHSARWLLPGEIAEVRERHGPDPTDPSSCGFLLITLTMSGGALASLEVNADSGYGYDVSIEMVAGRGAVGSPPLAEPTIRIDGRSTSHIGDDWLRRFAAAYELEVRAWVATLAAARPPLPSSWDGYMAGLAAEAVLESCESGGPVRLVPQQMPDLYAE
jgi:myo-inositol 2-dehydrogenase/D-chiro-inositol 1-dehydrogenase